MDFLSTPLPKSSGTIENFVYDPWRVGTYWGIVKYRWQGKTIRQWMQVLGVSGDNEYRSIRNHLKTHGNLLEYFPYRILHGLPLARRKKKIQQWSDQHPDWSYAAHQKKSKKERKTALIQTPKGKMMIHQAKKLFELSDKGIWYRCDSSSEQMKGYSRL